METKKQLTSEDINYSRKEIDRVYKIHKEGFQFSEDTLKEALEKVSKEAIKRTSKVSLRHPRPLIADAASGEFRREPAAPR